MIFQRGSRSHHCCWADFDSGLYSPGSIACNFRDPRILHYKGSCSLKQAPGKDHLPPELFSSWCYWWASLIATPFILISFLGIIHKGTEQYIVYCGFFHPGVSRIPGGMHSSNKDLRATFVVFKVILTIIFLSLLHLWTFECKYHLTHLYLSRHRKGCQEFIPVQSLFTVWFHCWLLS